MKIGMGLKIEFRLEDHKLTDCKTEISVSHLEPGCSSFEWIVLNSRFGYRITTKCKLRVPNLRLRYRNTT